MLLLTAIATSAWTETAWRGATNPISIAPRLHAAAIRAQQDPPPPELDEQQAAFMKARGFVWNAKTRAWAKGDPERLKKLEVRSSSRYLRWEGDQAQLPEETITAIREATRRFEKELRDAREEALQESEEDRRIALFVKNTFGDGIAVPLWVAWQLILGAACLAASDSGGAADPFAAPSAGLGDAAAAVAAGLAAAPALAWLRRGRWAALPGVEDGDGQLERLLVDARLGSYALPAPWEWRASERGWGLAAAAAEGLAGVSAALVVHGVAQARVVAALAPSVGGAAAAAGGVAALAAAAAGRALYFSEPAADGLPAEAEAAAKLAERAESYYGMTAATAAEGTASVAATRALAAAWADRFGAAGGGGEGRAAVAAASAAASAAVAALAWELGGHSIAAPALAGLLVAVDAYVLRAADAAERTVAVVRFDEVDW